MPTFDYLCKACGHSYDVFHIGKEIAEDNVCPTCSSTHFQRLLSAPAIASSGSTRREPVRTEMMPSPGSCCGGGRCGIN